MHTDTIYPRARALSPPRRPVVACVFTALALAALGIAGFAAAGKDAPVTPATEIHGLPGNNPGYGGSSANPTGGGVNGGDGIHDIADGAPGWDGTSAADGGEPPACTIHGGLGDNDGDHDIAPCE